MLKTHRSPSRPKIRIKEKHIFLDLAATVALPVCSVHVLFSSLLLCAESSKGAAACCPGGVPACSPRFWSLLLWSQAGRSVGSL